MPITSMLDAIRVKIMDMMMRRRDKCNKWKSLMCPKMEKSIGEDVHKFCDPYLVVSAFRDSYSHSINHVPDIEKPKGKPEGSFILPPDTKRTPGRRRNKRKESMGARERKLRVIKSLGLGQCIFAQYISLGYHGFNKCNIVLSFKKLHVCREKLVISTHATIAHLNFHSYLGREHIT
ncbi:hypothetical protein IFM89_015206 [Coptis chinensis]|uniref:Uncharacterized protein n=1 Tax=Coptis chinensis TaxID=261450 RepID=A0A835H6D4_9MAGN|nr:hypothetical protein IFM89_015206 [Coptis chinensis]